MRKYIFSTLAFLFSIQLVFSQLPTPEQFLGYKVGTHFTPHWKLVEYCKTIAAASPATVRLQQYGETNEGRPLYVIFLSSASNIANLETIRKNNLSLAHMDQNSSTSITNPPAIVWLSFNIHGNEAASSEASMLTLYTLADPGNAKARKWLENLVVVIDPCMNPDGRDRYVNWYNSVVGSSFNAAPESREHREPWPGGRSNHYNFDLNRDWAWQTQKETQYRVALFNSWLPQIHVDFHEQGYNSPYYFAPAAQPYHEVITPWQREFQNIIGHNNARYFDEKGWLFFTKEEFDLLYPSYGDTYPIYNGSIGMTYEQGGIGAGLGVVNSFGDTLTLVDRVNHHFTTALSTVEVAAQQVNRLTSEFKKFYTEATTTGVGKYKSYVIRYNINDAERIGHLLELLDKNKIAYGAAKAATFKGFNYDTGKEESATTTQGDIVIPSVQPRSALVKVLFEPSAVLVDSVTYDITAWSLPYVYGLKAFATREHVPYTAGITHSFIPNSEISDPYGYIIRWNGIKPVQLVSRLLQKGIKVRYNEEPFEAGGQSFDRGAVLILKTSNQNVPDLWSVVRNAANALEVPLVPVSSGFVEKGYDFGSGKVHPIKARRVAMLTGEGVSSTAAGEIWYFFENIIHYPLTSINANDFSRANLNNYDVLILPDGNYRFLNDKNASELFRTWVENGGKVIALQDAVAQLSKLEWSLKSKKDDDTDPKNIYSPLKNYETRDRDLIPNTTPGSIYKVELDNTHPLAFGYPKYYYTLKQDDNIYDFIKENGWNVGIIKKERQVSGFVGSRLKNRLKDGLLLGVQEVGRGTVTYLADDILFREFWENGKLLFGNAVFLVGQ